MSMWTGASDELASYLAQREVERQRELVQKTALQDRAYRQQRDVVEDARAKRTDERLEQQAKDAEAARKAQDADRDEARRYRNAAQLRESMQGGGYVMEDAPEKKALDEFNMGNDLYKKIALPVAKLPSQPAEVNGIPMGESITTLGGGTRFQNLGGTDYQAKQREVEARRLAAEQAARDKAEAAAAAAAERADLQRERLAAAAQIHADNAALRRELAQNKAGEDEVPLSEGAISTAARLYLQTGSVSSVGRGPVANNNIARIKNRAFEIDPEADITSNKIQDSADRQSLGKMTTAKDQLGALEQTGLRNLDVFLKTADKVADTGVPVLNRPVRAALGLFGQDAQAAFTTAHEVVKPELTRILHSGITGSSGPLTDSARHDIEGVLSGNATVSQYKVVADILRTDVANKKAAMEAETTAINNRMKARHAATSATTPPPAAGSGRGAPGGTTPAEGPGTTPANPGVWTRDASGKLVRK